MRTEREPIRQSGVIPELHPVPDASKLPEELQAEVREWNEAIDELTLQMITLAVNPRNMSYEEVMNEWLRIQQARYDRAKQLDRKIEAFASEPGVRNHVRSLTRSNYGEWSDLATRALLAISVAHEKWADAASACWGLGSGGPTHDSVWWDREVYYWRKAGLRGRTLLAFRTLMPFASRVLNGS